jgi:Amt family ammonium transporter
MTIDSGATAWVLVSAALVLFMTPGLAFFYGGMVRSKNVLGMLMQNIFAMGLISILWATVGFSLAFGGSGKYFGNFDFMFLKDVANIPNFPGYVDDFALIIPPLAFVVYQMMFAVITPALITGATADRMKFSAYCILIGVWAVVVYPTVAHWVFSPNGWLFQEGALDFAGGAVVHINAGAAALAVVLVLGKRRGWPREAMPPHNLPYTILGTGILWFGWFGFNAGSALAANGLAAQALINTQLAAASGMIAWLIIEKILNSLIPCFVKFSMWSSR